MSVISNHLSLCLSVSWLTLFTRRALFWVRCTFQPDPGELASNAGLNLNCSVGIGLEAAIGVVAKWSFIVFIVASIVFPALLTPLTGAGAILFFVTVIPAVAWHYSPRCWLMTPALFIPGQGAIGISIPYYPFPIAFPALPECIFDEIFDFIDKYLSDCYMFLWGTPLEFLFPPYMILGDPCPPCDQMVDIANCDDLGLSGGIENVAWFLVTFLPGVCSFVVNLGSICLFDGCIVDIFPFNISYLTDLLDFYKNASATGDLQFRWCFWAMLPSLALVLFSAIIIGTLIALAIQLLILFVSAVYQWILASPLLYFVPGSGRGVYEEVVGSTSADGGPYVAARIGDSSSTGDGIPGPPRPLELGDGSFDVYKGGDVWGDDDDIWGEEDDDDSSSDEDRRRHDRMVQLAHRYSFMGWLDVGAMWLASFLNLLYRKVKRD